MSNLQQKHDQVRTVFGRNLFEYLQPEISSFLLFWVDIPGLQRIKYFSHKHGDLSQVTDTQKEISPKHCPNLISFCCKFDML